MTDNQFDPLFGAECIEIPLNSAPLVSVLCQIRFPEIVSIQNKSFIAPFQERIRSTYPHLAHQQMKTVSFQETGSTVEYADEVVWRFVDARKGWRLSLGATFLSLETRKYVSRKDFIERLTHVVSALSDTMNPGLLNRIGTRYIDRVEVKEGLMLGEMLRPEMLGLSGTSISGSIEHSISEVMCEVKEGQMLARWGMLPERGTHDPEVMPPVAGKSWFLDVDTFAEHLSAPVEFDVAAIRETAYALATRAYSFFRWSVTDRFLQEFGGETK